MAEPRKDEATGQETTGHEWDGIEELNTPLPRWWLWVFYATIVWSIGYWILMPAWPLVSGYTEGLLGYSQRQVVAEKLAEARAAQAPLNEKIAGLPLTEIQADPDLLDFAIRGGGSAFSVNCSQCHGSGAAGSPGYPNLNDDAWIWGGTLEAIQTTIRVGVRSDHPETRTNMMPAFGRDGLLERRQVLDVVEYVLSFSDRARDSAAAERGAKVFADNCAACHGPEGNGNIELGSPDLSDGIWLFGGTPQDIYASVQGGRGGVMPAWEDRLDDVTIRKLAIYVHALGGGR